MTEKNGIQWNSTLFIVRNCDRVNLVCEYVNNAQVCL